MNNERLRGTIDRLRGTFADNNFSHMANYFLYSHGVADPYMCLADYDAYMNTFTRMINTYKNEEEWTRKSLCNIAGAGFFSSDRSIRDYAENIWHLTEVK